MFDGIGDRLQSELARLAPHLANDFETVASSSRKHAAWKGASMIAETAAFDSSWITREDYEEHGPAIVQKKCK